MRKEALDNPTTASWLKHRSKVLYDAPEVQTATIGLIVACFFTTCYEAQVKPPPESTEFKVLFAIEVLYASLFTIELGLNLLAHVRHSQCVMVCCVDAH